MMSLRYCSSRRRHRRTRIRWSGSVKAVLDWPVRRSTDQMPSTGFRPGPGTADRAMLSAPAAPATPHRTLAAQAPSAAPHCRSATTTAPYPQPASPGHVQQHAAPHTTSRRGPAAPHETHAPPHTARPQDSMSTVNTRRLRQNRQVPGFLVRSDDELVGHCAEASTFHALCALHGRLPTSGGLYWASGIAGCQRAFDGSRKLHCPNPAEAYLLARDRAAPSCVRSAPGGFGYGSFPVADRVALATWPPGAPDDLTVNREPRVDR